MGNGSLWSRLVAQRTEGRSPRISNYVQADLWRNARINCAPHETALNKFALLPMELGLVVNKSIRQRAEALMIGRRCSIQSHQERIDWSSSPEP